MTARQEQETDTTAALAGSTPDDHARQLRWLVDRAQIGDLLIEFARALDDRDWQAYADTYTEDGELCILGTVTHRGRADMADFVAGSLGHFAGTHHLSTNHAITIDGDEAIVRSYVVAAHLLDPDHLGRHADVAGWYECSVRRTVDGWRFRRVTLTARYLSGEALQL